MTDAELDAKLWAAYAEGRADQRKDMAEGTALRAALAQPSAEIAERNRVIEICAAAIEPKNPRPCDCTSCDCGDSGNTRGVAVWDASTAEAAMLRAMKETQPASEPCGWIISYTLSGSGREVFCRHNSVGDYRQIDPSATATPVFTAIDAAIKESR